MKIVAIDASTHSTGIAYFNEQKLEAYECFTASSTDLIKRIKKITNLINNFIQKYEVEKIILEEVRPENGLQNIKTHRVLMWLQAAIAFIVHDNYPKIEIEYIYPSEWRAACNIRTGRGIKRKELKTADINFVKDKFGIEANDDICDAIGIGYGYLKIYDNKILF
jgi:Holliday junction resolvasome RuvABC endonuclease subunit